ncbi:MAG: hypothetical protein ACLFPD_09675, partial [Desulfosudaceae bacterium]
SRRENADLFRATCGGMGLTGVILSATIRLTRIDSPLIGGKVLAGRGLADLLEGFVAWSDWPYLVAWLDGTTVRKEGGRFVLMAGRHHGHGRLRYRPRPALKVPCLLPGSLINRTTVKGFNAAYFEWKRRGKACFTVSLDAFFFPLDRLDNWNRLYGYRGFLQYQLVLPQTAGRRGLRTIFAEIARSSLTPSLAVLKGLGRANDNYLSFPLQGYTLALDYKWTPGLFSFFERLDRIVLECGGRLYLAKDARMPAAMMAAGYPGLDDFARVRDRYGLRESFQSRQSRRLDL